MESKEEKASDTENNEKINFKICIATGGEFNITANSKEIFREVLDKFLESHNKKELESMNTGICNGGIVDFDKNLEENNIKENTSVILYDSKKDFKSNPDDLDEKEKEEKEIIVDEKLLEELIMNEFINFQNVLMDNINLNSNNEKNKENENKDLNDTKEENNSKLDNEIHEHKLIFLYSNIDWSCKKCEKSFNDKLARYYSSICDYSLCENCFTSKKMYPLKEYSHEQTKLKIYNFPIHEHKLIYCRTSRSDDRVSQWLCDICSKNYNYRIWSFYCTNCDYDLCLNCAKKHLPKEDLISNIGIKLDIHEHSLIYLMTNFDWVCLVCLQSFDSGVFPCYGCTFCDFFVCQECIQPLIDEDKYLFYKEGKKENINEMKIKKECHEHPLIYCMTSKSSEYQRWKCTKCGEGFGMEIWGFYCSLCDYSLCYRCYNKMNKK